MVEVKPLDVLNYLKDRYGDVKMRSVEPLGTGVHGMGFEVRFLHQGDEHTVVVKTLFPENFGHDYPSDRAQVLLMAHQSYNLMPRHVRSIDVLGMTNEGLIPIGPALDFYIIMDEASGTPYFADLDRILETKEVTDEDLARVDILADFMAEMHAEKEDNPILYRRKIRDTVGHGECLMGVIDTYPDVEFTSNIEMTQIVMKAVRWWGKIKNHTYRLSTTHGDFHPGNIWWDGTEFTLLDRSRGLVGDPADDVSALTINYIVYGLQATPDFSGPFRQLFDRFFERYIEKSGDIDIFRVLAPFYAFRGVVVSNPIFYPDVSDRVRRKIFNFMQNILDEEEFKVDHASDYFIRA